MAQDKLEPARDQSLSKDFPTSVDVDCTISSGSGEVIINNLTIVHKFGASAGEVKTKSFNGVTKIIFKGTSDKNSLRIDS